MLCNLFVSKDLFGRFIGDFDEVLILHHVMQLMAEGGFKILLVKDDLGVLRSKCPRFLNTPRFAFVYGVASTILSLGAEVCDILNTFPMPSARSVVSHT